jgi:hypothetical protein
MWQDLIIFWSGVFFVICLLPQAIDCYHGKSINIRSALATGSVLVLLNCTYFTLGLYFAAIPFTATMWGIMAYLSWRNRFKI